MKEHIIEVNKNLCIGCSLCVKDCPVNNIKIQDKKAFIKEQDCIKCGHCVAICPKNAVTMTGFNEEPIEYDQTQVLNSSELLMALKSRRTVRKFKDKEVSLEIIQEIIEAGRVTPSAKNAQDVSYIVLNNDKTEYEKVALKIFKKLKSVAGIFTKSVREINIDDNFFFKKAPLVILVVTKDKISGSLAASNMSLMAESHGLGVLFSGFFTTVANNSLKLKRMLKLKRKQKIVATLVIGYPGVKYRRTTQKEEAKVKYL